MTRMTPTATTTFTQPPSKSFTKRPLTLNTRSQKVLTNKPTSQKRGIFSNLKLTSPSIKGLAYALQVISSECECLLKSHQVGTAKLQVRLAIFKPVLERNRTLNQCFKLMKSQQNFHRYKINPVLNRLKAINRNKLKLKSLNCK